MIGNQGYRLGRGGAKGKYGLTSHDSKFRFHHIDHQSLKHDPFIYFEETLTLTVRICDLCHAQSPRTGTIVFSDMDLVILCFIYI